MFTIISMASISFFSSTFFMAYKVVAFQKVENTVGSNEEVHWKTTYSWEKVTLTGGHRRGQKEWRLETCWNAAGKKQESCNISK